MTGGNIWVNRIFVLGGVCCTYQLSEGVNRCIYLVSRFFLFCCCCFSFSLLFCLAPSSAFLFFFFRSSIFCFPGCFYFLFSIYFLIFFVFCFLFIFWSWFFLLILFFVVPLFSDFVFCCLHSRYLQYHLQCIGPVFFFINSLRGVYIFFPSPKYIF